MWPVDARTTAGDTPTTIGDSGRVTSTQTDTGSVWYPSL
jgi:hypothetical protein